MPDTIKTLIKNTPLIGSSINLLREMSFKNSADYWDRRYRKGGTSGAGSYNRLARFKADFLNGFVEAYQISSVIEYGSGDGGQLKLACYPSYVGVDVSATAVEMCREMFRNDTSKRFEKPYAIAKGTMADLSLSLYVIYHLVEDSVFEAYMQQLFESARRFVIVYSSNLDQGWPAKHVRHREFTRWVAQNKPEWLLHSKIKNDYPYDPADAEQTSFADFYVFAPR